MNTPFVVFDRPYGEKRCVVMPDAYMDAISEPAADVCRRLAFVASSNGIEASAGVIGDSGAVRLLGELA